MNDISFAELLAALPPEALFVDPEKGVCVSIGLVIDQSPPPASLASMGTVEFCYKILEAANAAQKSKNNSLPSGSKLSAFSDPMWSTPSASGTVSARIAVSAQFVVNTSIAVAPIG